MKNELQNPTPEFLQVIESHYLYYKIMPVVRYMSELVENKELCIEERNRFLSHYHSNNNYSIYLYLKKCDLQRVLKLGSGSDMVILEALNYILEYYHNFTFKTGDNK